MFRDKLCKCSTVQQDKVRRTVVLGRKDGVLFSILSRHMKGKFGYGVS